MTATSRSKGTLLPRGKEVLLPEKVRKEEALKAEEQQVEEGPLGNSSSITR